MTRKRFVKLLMADGYSRNEANEVADDAKEGYSYKFLYSLHCVMRENPSFLEYFIEKATNTIEKAVEVFSTVWQQINEKITTVCELIRVELEAKEDGKT